MCGVGGCVCVCGGGSGDGGFVLLPTNCDLLISCLSEVAVFAGSTNCYNSKLLNSYLKLFMRFQPYVIVVARDTRLW